MNIINICKNLSLIPFFLLIVLLAGCGSIEKQNDFISDLSPEVSRVWIGPEYWANPLQDWRLENGRIECSVSGGDRNVFLLTHELIDTTAAFTMSVRIGRLTEINEEPDTGWVGFRIGIRGEFNDYRDSAVRGIGLDAGITTQGIPFIGNIRDGAPIVKGPLDDLMLELEGRIKEKNTVLSLTIFDSQGDQLARIHEDGIDADWLVGGVALVCSSGELKETPEKRPPIEDGNWGFRPGTERGGNVRFWFKEWTLSGPKVRYYSDRTYGPILFAQHAQHKGTLKMNVQMAPIGLNDSQVVSGEFRDTDENWIEKLEAEIDPLSRTALFRITDYPSDRDVSYRLSYDLIQEDKKPTRHFFYGTIKRDPLDKNEIVVAAFTGNNDLGFPNIDFVEHVRFHAPDLLFFSGDQIYEGVGGYGVERTPIAKAALDYLRKWFIFGWTYWDLMRDTPSISIPDDHDVYHGNLWGAGGKPTDEGLEGAAAQDTGGYKMPPEWVNMVQRAQSAHLPDPVDPEPVEQGIEVYFTHLCYGGVSFAVLEDRKFKSAPKMLIPEAEIWNGWPQNKDFDVLHKSDVPGAQLLGNRQLDFLKEWAADWQDNIWMKVVLSQTIFSTVATLPKEEMSDANVPKLRILREGEYPPNDMPVSDFDSDGWPQTGRNLALKEMRKGFALHIAGDQHLGSTIQYGIDDYGDANFAFCVPAVSNVWPRRWYPKEAGENQLPGQPRYTGDFEDGFGNKITVYAVSNPVYTGLQPSRLYDRATGYGIVRFHRDTRKITIECWLRISDPSQPDAQQYHGWPITIDQIDNYDPPAFGFLPEIEVTGMIDPVIQVINEASGEIVYTLRIKGNKFQPKAYFPGKYTVKVGEQGTDEMVTLNGLSVTQEKQASGKLTVQIR